MYTMKSVVKEYWKKHFKCLWPMRKDSETRKRLFYLIKILKAARE
jgi:hypothetical protein